MDVTTAGAQRDDRAHRRILVTQDLAQPLASSAALGVIVWMLASRHFFPSWPLLSAAILLGGGLLAEPVARRAGGRGIPGFTQPATAFIALLLVCFEVMDPHQPASPLRLATVLLALGVVLGPVAHRLAVAHPPRELALPAAALTAIVVFTWSLASDGYSFLTETPEVRFINDQLHVGTLRLVVVLLGLVVVAAILVEPHTIRRIFVSVLSVVALTMLLVTLATTPALRFYPEYPYYWAAAILSLGLVVELLTPVLDLQVLGRRIDELSRTRSGVLDVQASELRRIERDLHDGAQVRLVALTMKLGRAEDLYRDDPKAAALIREAREDATEAIRELRELARGIATPVLAKRGLEPAIRSLAQRSGLEVRVDATLTRRLAPVVESAAYFVVAESLANAAPMSSECRYLRVWGGALDGGVGCGLGGVEQVPDAAGEVAFEAADRFELGLALGGFAVEVDAGLGVGLGSGESDDVQGAVELAISAAVQAVALDFAA